MKSKLEIYALAVCFASVVCIVIAAGVAGYSTLEVVTPELTMNAYTYNRYQSNDAYWNKGNSCSGDNEQAVKPDEDTLTKERMEAFSIAIAAERRGGIQSLIRCFMFLLVGGITLFIHWNIAAKARN